MPIHVLQAGDRKRINTPAKYLNVIKADNVFSIDSPAYGLKELSLKQGHQAVLEEIGEVYLINNNQNAVSVEIENSNIRVFGGGAEAVEIVGNVTVDSILNGIDVATSVGSVEILDANTFDENEDIVVAANTKVQLLAADNTRKEAEIFVHGVDYVTCRYGSTNITNTKGRVIAGGGAGVVGAASIKGTAALYIQNTSVDKSITVSVGVEKRV